METRKLTDSTNVQRPAPLLPFDTSTEDGAIDCPPEWPTCGPEPKASDPVPPPVEPASSVGS